MTEYERGFATKCAEYGLTERQAGALFSLRKAGMEKKAVGWGAAAAAVPAYAMWGAPAAWGLYGAYRGFADHNRNFGLNGVQGAINDSDAEYTANMTEEERNRFDSYMRAQDSGRVGTALGRGWNSFLKGLGIRSQEDINRRYVDARREQADMALEQMKADQLRRRRIASQVNGLHQNPSTGPATVASTLGQPAAPAAPAAPATPAAPAAPAPTPASSGSKGTVFA